MQTIAKEMNQRREERVLQKGRVLIMTVANRDYSFSLTNISSWGASGRCSVPVQQGAQITLAFENGHRVAGRVRWVRGAVAGIEFHARLSREMILPARRQLHPRERRFAVSRLASVCTNGQSRTAVIRNVSSHGMQIQSFGELEPGQIVTIRAGDFECAGQVRWTAQNRSGVKLIEELSLDRFDQVTSEAHTPATYR